MIRHRILLMGLKKEQSKLKFNIKKNNYGAQHWLHSYSQTGSFVSVLIIVLCVIIVVSIKYYFREEYNSSILLDISPNLFTSIALPFIFYLFNSGKRLILYIYRSLLLILLYEVSQFFDPGATLDILDVLASLVGAFFAAYLLYII